MLKRDCTKCGVNKPIFDFHKNSSGKYGVSQRCKVCMNAFARNDRKENHTDYYARKYKVSIDVIKAVLSKVTCEICGAAPKETKRNSIDHCHTTGIVRGLLCDECNKGLGHFKDNPTLLIKAKEYLEKQNN
jgi:hypothetical protein